MFSSSALKLRVPDAVQRPSRCSAEPGPTRRQTRRGTAPNKKGGSRPPLLAQLRRELFAHHADAAATGAPDVDAGEQEQPHHVYEVPVPGGEFKAEMLFRRELPSIGTGQTDDQEDGADQHMKAVEAGR